MQCNRRQLVSGILATCMLPQLAYAVEANFNQFAQYAQAWWGWSMHRARPGQTWQSVFGSQAAVAKVANRQNVQLEPGQYYVVPPLRASHDSLCPLPRSRRMSNSYLVVISPRHFAWGVYQSGILLRWGPAVCGGSWCADVGRSCRTPVGSFTVSEVAGPERRSRAYPREAAAEGRGALMPYFMRLTQSGVGMHARYIHGSHTTHGCIGMFYEDAQWLNRNIARSVRPLPVIVESYL